MIGDVAFTFHFPPGEMWELDVDELMFWHAQAKRINDLKT